MVAELLEKALSQQGYQVWTADTGSKAIATFQTHHPMITILDLRLPDMNGLSVLRQLRAIDEAAKVIVLTGAGDVAIENEMRKLGVEDFLQKGLEFQVILQTIEKIVARSEEKSKSKGAARVLVADDDPQVRSLLQDYLTKQGYQVETARRGEEVLELVQHQKPHLVVLDRLLPGMDSFQVLKRLTGQKPSIEVIMLSAPQDKADEAAAAEALKSGCFDYLAKPVDLEQLGIVIRAKLTLMERSRHSRWRR